MPADSVKPTDLLPTDPLNNETIWGLTGATIEAPFSEADVFSTRPLLDLLRVGAAQAPTAIALVGQTSNLCYEDLLRLAQRAAFAVAQLVPFGQAVACVLPRTPRALAGLLGCLLSGRVCLVLDLAQPVDRLAVALADAAPAALMLAELLPCATTAPVLMLNDALAGPDRDWHPNHDWDPDAPFAVYFTSGSSGRPKGIVVSARYIFHRARAIAEYCAITERDCVFHAVAPITAHGLACVLSGLFRGARVLLAGVAREGTGAVLRLMERELVTCATIPPPVLRMLFQLERARFAFRALRTLRIASTALSRTDVAAWRPLLPPSCEIWHNYSSTEAQNVAEAIVPTDDTGEEPTVAAGLLQPFHDYALLGEDDRPVSFGEPGELVLRSRYVALGEWRDGRLVSSRMPPVPGKPGWRYFRTGDLVRIQPNGMLRVVGRVDRQIKINGIRVELGEIEAILRSDPAVKDAAVVAKPNSITLHAFVASAEVDRTALGAALSRRLASALPMSLRPANLTVLESLPMLANGKTDLAELANRTKQAVAVSADI